MIIINEDLTVTKKVSPNLLDLLPPPAKCDATQREAAIEWYAAQSWEALNSYILNTRNRISKEFYQKPHERLVGEKLHNLYAMREILVEASRRQDAVRAIRTQRTGASSDFPLGGRTTFNGTDTICMGDI